VLLPFGAVFTMSDESDPASSLETGTLRSSSESHQPVGPYRLLQRLGSGGMGEVWLAEQMEPVRRRVALKLIKAGMDTDEVVARFESERQALAMMDHPAIAKVFDAGSTTAGRPYFAMEYVPGVPITEHCDTLRLSTRDRLKLFIQVCAGVQHAHQKAVIHRDLKPSNVLVTVQDRKATPKIIDFGVAKAIAQPLTEKTIYTQFGAMVGTPEYMSPEQAGLTAQDVDTRTDVYSLGAILYQLLVGALPFESRDLRQGGYEGLRKKILEEEPSWPSARIRTLGASSLVAARNRSADRSMLARQLKGDLDWITMKALEKDRDRRYGSPSDLAADIQRHLNNEPVLARPASLAYRAGKFLRRHRFGVAVAAAAALLLMAFAGVMAFQARRIARERDRANREVQISQRVTEFLTGLFAVSDPGEAKGNTVTAREILDKGSEKILRELNHEPVIQARLMDTMGGVYDNLGLYDRATPLLQNALSIRRRALGNENIEVADSLVHLGNLAYHKGDLATAETSLRQALAMRRKVPGNEPLDTATNLTGLAKVLRQKETGGAIDEAERYYREALATRRKVLGGDDPAIADSLNNLAMLLYANKHDDAAAEPLFRESLAMYRRLTGGEDVEVAITMNNLALLLGEKGQYDEAEQLFRKALAMNRRILGENHPIVATFVNNLATLLKRKGDFNGAESLYRQAIDAERKVFPEDHWEVATIKSLLGGCLTAERRYREAEPLVLESYPIIESQFGDSHERTRVALRRIVDLYSAWGKPTEASRYKILLADTSKR
jgi:serine/threonine protein kinase/Tfp pilus assembly protein PilF